MMRPASPRAATALTVLTALLINSCGQPTTNPPPSPPPPSEPPSSPPPPPPPGTVDPNGKTFTFLDPGEVASPSGGGAPDNTVYLPGMRFPIETAPAYANSQVYAKGGSGGGGSQCDASNYSYPWRDTFCETRSWAVVFCPSSTGHQGQDIRPATCDGGVHWAVAAEDGQITAIGSYSVTLVSDSEPQRIYRYLHMKMSTLAVSVGDHVARGQHLGRVNNDFGGSATTYHLHFDVKTTVSVGGSTVMTYVPPYPSLIDAYKRLLAGTP